MTHLTADQEAQLIASLPRMKGVRALALLAAMLLCGQLVTGCTASPNREAAPKLLATVALETVFDWGNAFTPATIKWVRSSRAKVNSWVSIEDLPSIFAPPCQTCDVGEIHGHFRCLDCHRFGPILLVVTSVRIAPGRSSFLEFIWKKKVPLGVLGAVQSSQLQTLSRVRSGRAPDMLNLTLHQARWVAYRHHLKLRTRLVEAKGFPEFTVTGQNPKPDQELTGHTLELTLSLPYKPSPGAEP